MMDEKDRRIEQLEALLMDIALTADGHRHATAMNEDGNIALVNIRNMAAIALGLHDRLTENGTLFAGQKAADNDFMVGFGDCS